MMRYYWPIVYLLVLFSIPALSAQEKATISGTILDAVTDDPLPYVNVLLYQQDSSTLVTGNVTDNKGYFLLRGIDAGQYVLKLSYVGYRVTTLLINLTPGADVNIGYNRLSPGSQNLAEVTVTNQSQQAINTLERNTYFMERNSATAGATVQDMLQTLPGVVIDADGRINLRGSDRVGILINGRNSALTGAGRLADLEQIPISAVQRIEIINSPSANYQTDGSAGVINIVLKEDWEEGFHGEVGLTVGYDDIILPNLNLSYLRDRYNFFVQANGNFRETINRDQLLTRLNTAESDRSEQRYRTTEPLRSILYKAGTDILFGPGLNNTITLYGQYLDEESDNDGAVTNTYFDGNGGFLDARRRRLRLHFDKDAIDYAALFTHEFNSRGKKLSGGLIYSSVSEEETGLFDEDRLGENEEVLQPNVRNERTDSDLHNNTYNAFADYTVPMRNNSHFDVGWQSIFRHVDNDLQSYLRDPDTEVLTGIAGRNFDFVFNEHIHAAYALISVDTLALRYEAGVRLEYVYTNSSEDSTGFTFKNSYIYAYPNFKLGMRMSARNEILFSYFGRVNRPTFEQLNRVPRFADPTNLRIGNPALVPEYVHNVEYGWKMFGERTTITTSLFYRYLVNPIYTLASIDEEDVARFQPQNLEEAYNLGLELIASRAVTPSLDVNASLTGFINGITASEKFATPDRTGRSWTAKLTANLELPLNFVFQLDAQYQAPVITPLGRRLETFNTNLSLTREMFDGRGQFSFRVTDVFDTFRVAETYSIDAVQFSYEDDFETRFWYLGFTYNF